jgi:hypothetical protein
LTIGRNGRTKAQSSMLGTGAKGPRLLLEMVSMRQLAIAVLTFILCAQFAYGADEHCRLLERNADHTEWSEGDEFRGARIVSRDPRWELGEVDWNMASTASATCRTCSDHQISGGALWLGVSDRLSSDLYEWISADSIAKAIRVRSHSTVDVHAVSDVVQVSIGGFVGPARVLAINDRNGHSSQVIAVAVAAAKECLLLAGILSERDGAPTAIDRLNSLGARLQWSCTSPPLGNLLRRGEGHRRSSILAI